VVDTTLAIYLDNVPFGYPYFSEFKTWNSSNKATLTATPETGFVLFVKEVRFVMTVSLAFSSGKFHIKHSGSGENQPELDIEIDDSEQILHLADGDLQHLEFPFPMSTYLKKGRIPFNPPVKLLDDLTETLTINDDASLPLTISGGSIVWNIVGWQMTEAEYSESQ